MKGGKAVASELVADMRGPAPGGDATRRRGAAVFLQGVFGENSTASEKDLGLVFDANRARRMELAEKLQASPFAGGLLRDLESEGSKNVLEMFLIFDL